MNIGFLKLGKLSSEFYLAELIKVIQANNHQLTVHDVNFEEWNQYLPFQFDELTPRLESTLTTFNQNYTLDKIIIPNITLHLTLDRLDLPKDLKEKVIHPINETVSWLKKKKIKQVTLLGTRHTMNSDLMEDYFRKNDLRLLPLKDSLLTKFDELRTKVYEQGVRSDLEKQFDSLTRKVKNPIIGCTELSLLNTKKKYTDFAQIQIQHILE